MTKLYAAYGSNINISQMVTRCPDAKFAGKGILNNYHLVFRGRRNNAHATIESKLGSFVPIALWDITPICESALDKHEGYPIYYRKDILAIETDNGLQDAMIYIMTDGKEQNNPNEVYFATIYNGYRYFGFDTNIIKNATVKLWEF